MRIQHQIILGFAGLVLAVISTGCKKEEPECVPSGKVNVVEVEKIPLPNKDMREFRKKLDQCHACVQSKKGYYSCQVAWQAHKEPREELKRMAREKACDDAGYPKGDCPDSAVKLLQCKGDMPVKETELSKSFKRMLKNTVEGKPINARISETDDAQTSEGNHGEAETDAK